MLARLILLTAIGASVSALTEGGAVGPTGIEVACDLPPACRMRNVGGRDGAGLCVFTSINHAAHWQNEPRLKEFQRQMRAEPGGGYPEKVDRMIAKYASGAEYVQHTGGDLEFLWHAIKSGRMPSVTYDGRDMHYGPGRSVAHMVNLVHMDPPEKSPRMCAILDNNFPGEKELVWMTVDEFAERWRAKGGGWAVVLKAPRPALTPRNSQ